MARASAAGDFKVDFYLLPKIVVAWLSKLIKWPFLTD